MSQITRCPACATSFKVVADQLRISDGWVRCGQCKEVFDAAAQLLPAPPPSMLPGVSLTDTRPPPAPVARKPQVQRNWGEAAGSTPLPLRSPAPANVEVAGPVPEAAAVPQFSPGPGPDATDSGAPAVLVVPEPAVPAFLAADSAHMPQPAAAPAEVSVSDPLAWRGSWAHPKPAVPLHHESLDEGAVQLPVVVEPDAPGARALEEQALAAREPAFRMAEAPGGMDEPAPPDEGFAQDPRGRAAPDSSGATPPAAPSAFESSFFLDYPPLDLPVKPDVAAAETVPVPSSVETEGGGFPSLQDIDAGESRPGTSERAQAPQSPAALDGDGLALVEDDNDFPSASARARTLAPPRENAPAGSTGLSAQSSEEVGFVVAARRKAFWRTPGVRAVLMAVLLVALLGIALQVAVQERDRIAALEPRLRPWLMELCGALRCDIAPQRQISDVVIESSSFNKARGDSYQLALTIRNKAGSAVAPPAIELTLTDVQDQPVVRRVLLASELGAPAELAPRGEWATSVMVAVTTGGARVAGYRLLAFYP